jgi:hypothetical protein
MPVLEMTYVKRGQSTIESYLAFTHEERVLGRLSVFDLLRLNSQLNTDDSSSSESSTAEMVSVLLQLASWIIMTAEAELRKTLEDELSNATQNLAHSTTVFSTICNLTAERFQKLECLLAEYSASKAVSTFSKLSQNELSSLAIRELTFVVEDLSTELTFEKLFSITSVQLRTTHGRSTSRI